MPELPEVETVRAGLAEWISGRVVADVEVSHPRAIRRHVAAAGPDGATGADFGRRLRGHRLGPARRRGKYLWLALSDSDECLLAHLGMSGQLLVRPTDAPDERHLHVRVCFADDGPQLRFIDQRTFGGLLIDELVPVADVAAADATDAAEDTEETEDIEDIDATGETVPSRIAHIARDPLDERFDEAGFVARVRRRHSAIKRALLDQSLISGVGNIYADEALWRAGVHGRRLADTLTRPAVARLLAQTRDVLTEAIRAGGTSFDALYVNVNGESGYFDRTLAVYGQEHEPCPRCGRAIRREAFMNRSSYFCPHCQRAPRR